MGDAIEYLVPVPRSTLP